MNQTSFLRSRVGLLLSAFSFLPLALSQAQEITTKEIDYESDGETMKGFLAHPELEEGEKRPGILLIHDWTGLQDYEEERAKQLASLGYVAFAADIYGEGVRPDTPQECVAQSNVYKGDRALFRKRLNDGLAELKKQEGVDQDSLAAIGYCFGGTGVIELARSGADIAGVVSFHGSLDSPTPEDGKNIKAKVLVLHGADDPHVPMENIRAFVKEMNDAEVDWQMIAYSGAVHAFTKKAAGDDPSTGVAYDEDADRRSWEHMKVFFDELFPDREEKE